MTFAACESVMVDERVSLSTVYNLPFELGIIFATISHESQSLMMAVTGLSSYAVETLRK